MCTAVRSYSVYIRVLYGAVFPIGSVRFNRTEPHRRIFALFKTEPHCTVGPTIMILENRTEPHRRT